MLFSGKISCHQALWLATSYHYMFQKLFEKVVLQKFINLKYWARKERWITMDICFIALYRLLTEQHIVSWNKYLPITAYALDIDPWFWNNNFFWIGYICEVFNNNTKIIFSLELIVLIYNKQT